MNQPKATYLFDGYFNVLSPFATCSPALSEKSGKGANLIPTFRGPSGARMYIPGQGIRSKLRGALTHVAAKYQIERKGRQISLEDAQYLRIGGVKQEGAEASISPDVMSGMLETNPLISLFGASTPWVTGKLMCGHAIDVVNIGGGYGPMLVDGVRADPVRRDPSLLTYLNDSAIDDMRALAEKIKASSGAKREIKKLELAIKTAKDTEAKIEMKSKLEEMKKAAKEINTVSTQMPLPGYNAIPPGARLEHKMRVLSATEMELGAILVAIDEFARQPVLGAHIAHGNGEIEASWDVAVGGTGERLGSVSINPYMGIVFSDPSGLLASAFNKFRSALESDGFNFQFDKDIILAKENAEDKGDGNE